MCGFDASGASSACLRKSCAKTIQYLEPCHGSVLVSRFAIYIQSCLLRANKEISIKVCCQDLMLTSSSLVAASMQNRAGFFIFSLLFYFIFFSSWKRTLFEFKTPSKKTHFKIWWRLGGVLRSSHNMVPSFFHLHSHNSTSYKARGLKSPKSQTHLLQISLLHSLQQLSTHRLHRLTSFKQ